MPKRRRLSESTAACDSLREQLEALLEEADLAAGRGDVERVKSILVIRVALMLVIDDLKH